MNQAKRRAYNALIKTTQWQNATVQEQEALVNAKEEEIEAK